MVFAFIVSKGSSIQERVLPGKGRPGRVAIPAVAEETKRPEPGRRKSDQTRRGQPRGKGRDRALGA